ncbi:MAG: glycosyltransferase family 39 protein [Anaerolineae bacterium]|nr:glycosyltransferase family 39 protein [Anaerolineae bacterium]
MKRRWNVEASERFAVSTRVIVVVLLLLAATFRAGYLRSAPRGMQFDHVDARGYHWLAINLLSARSFSMDPDPPLRPDYVRAPLYPLFVALWYAVSGPSPDFVVFTHVLVEVLTVAVVFRFGKTVADERVGKVAALLYALSPSSWRFCNELLTEILFGLLLTVSVWMFARHILSGRNRDALACGIAFGFAILCKPNVQFLPLALLAIMAHGVRAGRRRWWRGAAIVGATIAVMLVPWVVRNRVVFGKWFYTRTFDDNLAHVSAVATLAEVRGERVAPWTPRWEELYDEVVVRTALRYGWSTTGDRELSARQRDRRLQQAKAVALEILREHPVDFVVSHTRAWLWAFVPQEHRFWYARLTGEDWASLPTEGDALGRALRVLRAGDVGAAARILIQDRLLALPPLALVLWLGWGVLYAIAAALFAIGALRLRPRVLAVFIGLTIVYVTFVPGPISQIRFRLPVTPQILTLVAVGALGLNSRSNHVNPQPRR